MCVRPYLGTGSAGLRANSVATPCTNAVYWDINLWCVTTAVEALVFTVAAVVAVPAVRAPALRQPMASARHSDSNPIRHASGDGKARRQANETKQFVSLSKFVCCASPAAYSVFEHRSLPRAMQSLRTVLQVPVSLHTPEGAVIPTLVMQTSIEEMNTDPLGQPPKAI